ncbi:MAG: Gfo/Idh/MocA family oxidoreductase [Verrucomicrobia bacterium]|nr:Gfo/Idh/MocA family oxidoreductase [Verrucomicrobiota bacterium]
MKSFSHRLNRRAFIGRSLAAGAVASDVDENFLNKAAQAWPQARLYRDYRKMLEAEASRIDAVVVSTADHTHAPATSAALALGKPVYCEKPLTHTVAEARAIARLAVKQKVATQMGTQIHASGNYRRVVELVQSGAIGQVTAVYNWCNKGWSNGRFTPGEHKVPANLDWDLWLGPAKERPYSPSIHPANWRRFWEYGSGTFGDMAAHVMDLPFWALKLRYPTAVQCEGPEVHPDGAPSWVKAEYDFPAREGLPAVKFHWSDGGAHHDIVKNTLDHDGKPLAGWGLGVLFVGDKGMLAADYGKRQLLPKDKFADFKAPAPSIAESIGHWKEWTQACKTGSPTTCNFDYSGALTETILLGIVAFRSGKPLVWDAKNLRATNFADAQQYIRKTYRKGFEVVGLA